ncbi:hypothetical protein quinque_006211 [Culex quinquefasciatus]
MYREDGRNPGLPVEVSWCVCCPRKTEQTRVCRVLTEIVGSKLDQRFVVPGERKNGFSGGGKLVFVLSQEDGSWTEEPGFAASPPRKGGQKKIQEDGRIPGLLVECGPNSDSGLQAKPANFKGIEKFVVDSDILFPVIAEWYVFVLNNIL